MVPWQKPVGTLFALGLMASPALADWPTTSWVVICSDDTNDKHGATTCDRSKPASVATHYEQELETASRWLEELGFRSPTAWRLKQREGRPYAAMINDQELGSGVGGLYDPGDDDTGPGYLTLSSDLRTSAALGAESVHELFHGVQQSYRGLNGLKRSSKFTSYQDHLHDLVPNLPQYGWIIEGTADAIRVAFARRHGMAYRIRKGVTARYYDIPLHQSCSFCPKIEYRNQTYNTVYFWLALGEMLKSREDVAFLHDIWTDVGASPDTAHQGLTPVDTALRRISGEGLAVHYPAFIAHHANDAGAFSKLHKIDLTHGIDRDSHNGQVLPVAANAHLLRVQVAEGRTRKLRIDMPQDHPDLHLIIDDQLVGAPGPNSFEQELQGRTAPYEFLIRVANLAESPADTMVRDYVLRAELDGAPFSGQLIARFTGFNQNMASGSLSLFGVGSAQWEAELDVRTGPPVPEADPYAPPANAPQLVYPDDGSTYSLEGRYSSRHCEVNRPDICPYNEVEQVFVGSGAVGDRGTLRIVVKDGQPVLEASLPVTVSSTRSLVMGQPETDTEQETVDLACSSDENWVNDGGPATGYRFPNTASLAGKWENDRRNSVIFDCALDISDNSFGDGSTALVIQGRIEAGRHD